MIVVVALLGAGLAAYLLVGRHAHSTQATPPPAANDGTVSVCGERKPADIEKYTGPVLPSPAFSNEITSRGAGSISSYRYWAASGGGSARWYLAERADSSKTLNFTVYAVSDDALVTTFAVVPPPDQLGASIMSTFAVDPASGDVYVASDSTPSAAGVVSRWNTVGREVWSSRLSRHPDGAVYGYGDAAHFRVAVVVDEQGAQAHSAAFGADGRPAADNVVVGDDVVIATQHHHDIVAHDRNTVRIYNSDGTARTFFVDTLPSSESTTQPAIYGANELADGTIVVSDYASRTMSFLDSAGALLGAVSSDIGAGGPLDTIDPSGNIEVVNNRIYYIAENPFNAPNKLTYVTVPNAQLLYRAPQKAPYQLGIGAAIVTNAAYDYFPAGAPPQAGIQFASWWQSVAAGYRGSYTVRSIQQVKALEPVASTGFDIPGMAASYHNGSATVPITLPAGQPGYYEIDVKLRKDNVTVGADCLGYSVGAPDGALEVSRLPTSESRAVQLASKFGQRLYRSTYNLDACFPDVTKPDASTTLRCPASLDGDIAAGTQVAGQLGVTYEVQLGTGTAFDRAAIATGQWQRLVGLMAAHFRQITYWECWNEPNNAYPSVAGYVTDVLKPCHDGVKSVDTHNAVIGGSFVNVSLDSWHALADAGGLKYMDVAADHPYTGHNRSFEEQGQVVPPAYAATGEVGQLQQLQQFLRSRGFLGPLFSTESGFWSDGTNDAYTQGDKLVRSMVLDRSIGLDHFANFFNDGAFQVDGATWALLGRALTSAGLAASAYQDEVGSRPFVAWMPTQIPHTYAAQFGPSSRDPSQVVVVWSDDFSIDSHVAVTGQGAVQITDEWGGRAVLAARQPLRLSGSVHYVAVPAGQTAAIRAIEPFGADYASSREGAVASASSSWRCGSFSLVPSQAIDGIATMQGNGNDCDNDHSSLWIAAKGDSAPSLTITLSAARSIDRVYVSSQGIGSVETGLRDYDVQVDDGSGVFVTVARIRSQFFERNRLVSFDARKAHRIRLTNIKINYSGYGDGSPPTFWNKTLNDQVTVYEVGAFAPGS